MWRAVIVTVSLLFGCGTAHAQAQDPFLSVAPTKSPNGAAAPVGRAPVVAVPQSDEDALKLAASDRRLVQQRLTALGHDTAGTDGVFGPASRAAIAGYQRSIGVAATGYLTASVFGRLRQDAPLPAAAAPSPALPPAFAAAGDTLDHCHERATRRPPCHCRGAA